MHNVHEHQPVTLETRWTLSYLRGPMGREELRRAAGATAPAAATPASQPAAASAAPSTPAAAARTKPVLPSGLQDYYLKGDGRTPAEYGPVLYGAARVRYTDPKRAIDVVRPVYAVAPVTSGPVPVDWTKAMLAPDAPDTLSNQAPNPLAAYRTIPAPALDPKRYPQWTRDFEQWVASAQPMKLFSATALKLLSTPDESERDFQIRIQHASRESRDAALEELRARYATKIARVADKKRKAEEIVGREQQQVTYQKLQTAVSIGATVLGAWMGRRSVSLSTLGRATTAVRGVGRSIKETEDVTTAKQRLTEAEQEEAALNAEIEREVAKLSDQSAPVAIEAIEIKPKRGAVEVQLVALAWQPTAY
jgi:hypothetical protein